MSQEVADLYVVLRGMNKEFTASMAEAGAASERADSKIASVGAASAKMALGFGVAAVAVGAESVKMAASFDRQMEQISTLAGVPQAALAGLSKGVLNLAGQVGFAPESLAEALYHVESSFASTGITGAKAMEILKTAAEGAQVGHANLVDVTNALDAAIASGIPGVENFGQAMGALNSIVGSGDMQMQDLANAFSTGILAIGKQYGATLSDVGAALATFGDNNIRGQVAATDLRMAIMDLTKQAKPGVKALESIGISAGQLGKDMQTGGMNKAIIDLKKHLDAAGVTGTKVGSFLEDAFTKKSSAPLAVLLGEFDRLESKYPEIAKGANKFKDAWAETTKQFAVRTQEVKAQGEAWLIQLGNKLIPILTDLMGKVMGVVKWFGEHKKAAAELGTVIKDLLIGGLVLAGIALATMAVEAVIAAAPFVLLSLAIGALATWLIGLYKHNAKFKAFVDGIVADAKRIYGEVLGWLHANGPGVWQTIKDTFETAAQWAQTAFSHISEVVRTVIASVNGWLSDHRDQIQKVFSDISKTVRSVAGAFSSAFTLVVAVVKTVVKVVEDLWSRFGQHLIDHIRTALSILVSTAARLLSPLLQVFRGVFEVVKGIFDVFVGIFTGKWSKFWSGLTQIFGGLWNVFLGVLKAAWTLVTGIVREAWNLLSTIFGAGIAVISAAWGLLWHMLETLVRNAWTSLILPVIKGMVGLAVDVFVRFPTQVLSAIASLITGIGRWALSVMATMLGAIKNGAVAVFNWFTQLPVAVIHAAGDIASSVMSIGTDIVTGIWQGIENMGSWLADKLGSWAKKVIPGPIAKVLGIASPSKVMADLAKWIPAGLAKGITEGGSAATDAMTTLGNSLRSKMAWAVNNLNTVMQTYMNKVASVRDNIVSGSNLANAGVVTNPDGSTSVTTKSILDSVTAQRTQAQAFAQQIGKLKSMGLNSAELDQLASAGPQQAGAQVSALATASKKQIQQLNDNFTLLNQAATKTGVLDASKMYGNGVAAAQGLVKGLQSQEKQLIAQAMSMGTAMVKAIKKALGIASPSKVMADLAQWIPAGVALGIDTHAGLAADAMTRLGGKIANSNLAARPTQFSAAPGSLIGASSARSTSGSAATPPATSTAAAQQQAGSSLPPITANFYGVVGSEDQLTKTASQNLGWLLRLHK